MKSGDKDIAIIRVINEIISHYGEGFFETYLSDNELKLIDFWEADLLATSLKRGQKVIYISAWNFRFREPEEMLYYVELELIDEDSLETKEVVKQVNGAGVQDILLYIKEFMS